MGERIVGGLRSAALSRAGRALSVSRGRPRPRRSAADRMASRPERATGWVADVKRYKIVRFYQSGTRRTIRTGLTLEEAGRALAEAAAGTLRSGAARAEAAPLPLLLGRDVLAAVEQTLDASQAERAGRAARLFARPSDDRGAVMMRQEKWAVARDAAVLCTLAMGALALVLLILERAYA